MENLVGKRFDMLEVIEFVERTPHRQNIWKCKCDCGNIILLRKDQFIYPYSNYRSCGCWHKIESSRRPKDELGRFKKLERGEKK